MRALFSSLGNSSSADAAVKYLTESIGTLGGGDADVQLEHKVRCTRLLQFFSLHETRWMIALFFMALKIVERITFFLMPNREKRAPTDVRTHIHSQDFIDLIMECRAALVQLLLDLGDDESDVIFLLRAIGLSDDDMADPKTWRFMRRIVLHFSAGLNRWLLFF